MKTSTPIRSRYSVAAISATGFSRVSSGRVGESGVFRDEDFNAGQIKFSDTTSSVTGGRIGYGALDIGRADWVFNTERLAVVPFVGYGQWSETVDAYGATDHLGFIGGDIPHNVLVITNKVVWKALRVGVAAQLDIGPRTRLDVDLALIPYGKVRNDDSHHLRTSPSDLGPVPNIVLEGEGRGVQADVELRHEVRRHTQIGIGVRYWHLDAYEGERFLPSGCAAPADCRALLEALWHHTERAPQLVAPIPASG